MPIGRRLGSPVNSPYQGWCPWAPDSHLRPCSPQAPPRQSLGERLRALLRQSVGYLCILGTIATWVLQNELLQCLQTATCLHATRGFNKPYTMTWWNHSCLALLLPLSALIRQSRTPPSPSQAAGRTSSHTWLPRDVQQAGLTHWRMLCLGLPLAVIYLIADYFLYLALPYTTVFVATAIMNSNCVFVFLLSIGLFREKVSYLRIQALLIAMGGILVISSMAPRLGFPGQGPTAHYPHKRVHETMYGDLNAAVAAVFYALYEVCFAKFICSGLRLSSAQAISAISGYIGLSTLLFLWPGIFLVHSVSNNYILYHEHLRWPIWEELLAMAIGGSLTLIFNVLILMSVALTSPLKTNIGCMLMIPISGFVDWSVRGVPLATANIFGGALIVGGFLLLILEE